MSRYKLILLGEGNVGKTSLLLRFCNSEYMDTRVTTLRASFLSKRMVIEQTKVVLDIWDTAGQERFHSIAPIYYKDTDGALVCYDITDSNTLLRARKWCVELREMLGNDVIILLIGTKCDMISKVVQEDVDEICKKFNVIHMLTSARQNIGVDEAFFKIASLLIKDNINNKKINNKNNLGHRPKTIAILEDTNKPPSSCC